MAELKARIKHKIGTPDEWSQATNFSPLKGELVVYNDATNPRMKIGDGETNVNDLPFINNAFVTVDLDGAGDGEDFTPDDNLVINAETLGGKPASSYMLKTDTATDSNKLGGKDPEYYLSPWLTGITEEITPTQVYQALLKEQNMMITYPNSPFGAIAFTGFGVVGGLNIVAATEVLQVDGEVAQCQLVGNIDSNIWNFEITRIATYNEITNLTAVNSEKLGGIEASNYVRVDSLNDYTLKTELNNYTKTDVLTSTYATKTELSNYVKISEINNYITSAIGVEF